MEELREVVIELAMVFARTRPPVTFGPQTPERKQWEKDADAVGRFLGARLEMFDISDWTYFITTTNIQVHK